MKSKNKRSILFLYLSTDEELNFLLDISDLILDRVYHEVNYIFFINLHTYIHDKINICNNLNEDILVMQYMLNKDIDSNEKLLIQANIDKKLVLIDKTKQMIMDVKPIYQRFYKYILFSLLMSFETIQRLGFKLTEKNKLRITAIKKFIPIEQYKQLLAIKKEIDYSDIFNNPESYKSYTYDEIFLLHSKNKFPIG